MTTNQLVKVIAEVRDGSLIHLDETKAAEAALERALDWIEVNDSRVTAGSYFQCFYEVMLPATDAAIAQRAISVYRYRFDV